MIEMNGVSISQPTDAGTPPAQAELISSRDSSKLVNMGIMVRLHVLVTSAGGRIGGLGVKLIREIKG